METLQIRYEIYLDNTNEVEPLTFDEWLNK